MDSGEKSRLRPAFQGTFKKSELTLFKKNQKNIDLYMKYDPYVPKIQAITYSIFHFTRNICTQNIEAFILILLEIV